MLRFYTFLLLVSVLPLAACQSPRTVTTASHPSDWQDVSSPCNAESVQRFIGQKAGAAIIAQAVKDSGAATYRVLAPNTPATLDLSQHRLNVITDADGIITALHCG